MHPVTVTWSPEARVVCVLGAGVCVLGEDVRGVCCSGGGVVCDCAVTTGCAVINANATVPAAPKPAANFLVITGFSFWRGLQGGTRLQASHLRGFVRRRL